MKVLLILLLVAGLGIGVSRFGSQVMSRLPSPVSSRLPVKMADAVPSSSNVVNVDSKVLGAQTTANSLTEKLSGLFSIGGEAAGQAIKVVSESPKNDSEVVDVSKIAASMASSVENIPGNVAQQAKIEYCKQVLIQATASAKSQ